VLTNVAEASSSQQCIGCSMSNHIGITMTYEHSFTRKWNATQDEDATFNRCVGELMDVEPLADSNINHQTSPRSK
jgi:hypothetical protein